MREIKFRAWNGKEIFNIDVMAISACTWDCPDYGKRGVSLAYQPSIQVMQYTGLKDKDGREIYEGDIVEQLSERTYESIRGVVKFIEGSFVIECIGLETGVYLFDEVAYNTVLGNIYENPELLEGV